LIDLFIWREWFSIEACFHHEIKQIAKKVIVTFYFIIILFTLLITIQTFFFLQFFFLAILCLIVLLFPGRKKYKGYLRLYILQLWLLFRIVRNEVQILRYKVRIARKKSQLLYLFIHSFIHSFYGRNKLLSFSVYLI